MNQNDTPTPTLTTGSTVTEPLTTDAVARLELDEPLATPSSPPLALEVDVPRSVVDELRGRVDLVDTPASARDFLLEQVDIQLRFTTEGEPVDLE